MFSGSAKVVAFVSLDSRHPWRGTENDGGRGHAWHKRLWIPDTPGGVPRMTAGGGSIARLVPGNPVKRVLPSDLPLSFNLVRIKAGGGGCPSRRQDQSYSCRPRRWGCPLPPSGSKPQSPPKVGTGAGGGGGGGNPVALASSTYCRFTSARLAPAPVRIKAGGNPLLPSGSK